MYSRKQTLTKIARASSSLGRLLTIDLGWYHLFPIASSCFSLSRLHMHTIGHASSVGLPNSTE